MEEKCSQRWLCQCFLLFAVIFLWDQAGGKSALLLWVCVSVGNVTVSSRVEQGIKKGGNRRDCWLFLVLTALFLGGPFSLISNECTSAMKDGQPSQSQASQFLRQLFWGAAVDRGSQAVCIRGWPDTVNDFPLFNTEYLQMLLFFSHKFHFREMGWSNWR